MTTKKPKKRAEPVGAAESQAVPTVEGKIERVREMISADLLNHENLLVLADDPKPIRIGSANVVLPLCGICGTRAEVDLKPCAVDGFRFTETE